MPALLLVLSIAAGIVCADRLDARDLARASTASDGAPSAAFEEGTERPRAPGSRSSRTPRAERVALLVVALGGITLGGIALVGRSGRGALGGASRPAHPATAHAPLVRGVCLLAAAGFAFAAGHAALSRELDRARTDAQRVARSSMGDVRRIEARVVARRTGRWGDVVTLRDVRAIDAGPASPASLLLHVPGGAVDAAPSRAERLLVPGARVRLGVRLARIHPRRNPGGIDRERMLARQGLAARARLVDDDWVVEVASDDDGPRASLASWRADWRRRVGEALARAGPSSGLARVLAIGDRSGVTPATRDAFRRLGLAHLLAVSGLHVGLVAGLVGAAAMRVRVRGLLDLPPFDVALALACLGAWGYAWLTAAGVSVERAALLFALFTLGRIARRRIPPAQALAWVASVLLLSTPSILYDLGARLSFSACAGLVAAGVWRGDRLEPASAGPHAGGWRERARQSFRASLAASLGTLPMLLGHGIAVGVVAPAVNVLAVPWVGLVALPCALAAALASPLLPAGALAFGVWPSAALERAAVGLANGLPVLDARAGLPWWLCLALVALALRAARRERWGIAFAVWGGVALAGASPFALRSFAPPPPRVVFFDVGQGDAALVQGRRGTLVVDTGPGPGDGSGGVALVQALRAADVHAIDVLVVSHADLDHRGGARRVLGSFDVDELWLPAAGGREADLRALARHAAGRGTDVRWVAARAPPAHRGALRIEVLWPPAGSPDGAARNARSMVLRVELGGAVLLFAADIGIAEEAALVARDREALAADLLKVGHHGSRSSSSATFLAAVAPRVAVVSAPCDPSRGLPNGATLDRLRAAADALWWTGRDGAVIVAPRAIAGDRPPPGRLAGGVALAAEMFDAMAEGGAVASEGRAVAAERGSAGRGGLALRARGWGVRRRCGARA